MSLSNGQNPCEEGLKETVVYCGSLMKQTGSGVIDDDDGSDSDKDDDNNGDDNYDDDNHY